MSVTVLGVRHHGPGSARAVHAELARLRPDAILIEGPPEADGLIPLAPEMEPPVALLAHTPGSPRSAFWPFAVFSPEWQAILYGTTAGVPVRFVDLPAVHTLAMESDDSPHADPLGELAAAAGYDDPERWWEDVVEHRGDTPFQTIAEAMAAVREGHVPGPHEARREAHMRRCLRAAVKEGFERIAVVCGAWHVPALTGALPSATADNALLRGLPKVKAELTWVPWTYGRLAARSGYGAGITSPGWYHHLFAVADRPVERWLTSAAAVLREEGMAVSPAHVIEAVRLAESLAALRGRPLAGLSEVTEAVRAVLCDGDELLVRLVQRRLVVGDRLGTVSPRTPMVPLQRDLRDQQRRVKLGPEAVERELDLDLRKPLDLARSRLLHRLRLLGVDWGRPGESRGRGTFREVWRLAWRPEYDVVLIESAALGTSVESAATHRARTMATGGSAHPETPVPGPAPGLLPGPAPGLLPGPAAGPPPGPAAHGVPGSGAHRASGAAHGVSLAELTGLVERCLLADLGGALPEVLAALSNRAALDTDVTHLMAALPAMVRAQRYGDVRGTPSDGLEAIAESMLDRICAGLPVAVTGIDDEAAAGLVEHLEAVHAAVALLTPPPTAGGSGGGPPASVGETPSDHDTGGVGRVSEGAGEGSGGLVPGGVPSGRVPAGWRRWVVTLRAVCDRARPHPLIEGRLTRLLLDAGELTPSDAGDRMARSMSRGNPPARAAAWVEGFMAGKGLLLVHDSRLLSLVDGWLIGLTPEEFTGVLPLLRRTFSRFEAPERRAIGERVRASGTAADGRRREVDEGRAAAAVRTARLILGVPRG
ncbi:hypothetical protein GCM10010404_13080 [Nonomuraea africana]|uniref:Uncharacterized protein n=1 Tax=Nonomuraea africana TaxID=46171 RepID=A0ABR9K9A7_9ACTN|nr:DUF5682 family protein [Nonomuraea africana]MBE1558590.1 hypothetical protein [Nonomuraea africana]